MKKLFLIFIVLSSFLIGCSPKMVPPPHIKSREEIILAAREQEKSQMYHEQINDTTKIDSTKQTWYKDYSDYQNGELQTYSTLTINVDPNPYWSPYFYFGYTWVYPYYVYPYYWGYPYYYGYYGYPYYGGHSGYYPPNPPHHGLSSGNGYYYGHRPPMNHGPNQRGVPNQMNQQKRGIPNQMNRGQNPRYQHQPQSPRYQNYYPNYKKQGGNQYYRNPNSQQHFGQPNRQQQQHFQSNPSGGYRGSPSGRESPSGGYRGSPSGGSHPSSGGGHSGGGRR